MRTTFDASPAAAMSFLLTQRTHIEPQVYAIKYPDVTYQDVIPVDTSAPEWAPIVAVASVDARGELAFLGPNSNDINRADVGYKMGTHPVQTAALGYGYTIEELNQARLMGANLSADKASARSEERRVGRECRSRWPAGQEGKHESPYPSGVPSREAARI